ncbi:MAG: hypothetical protein PHS74_00515 [Lachnospiraceae bacterium]|nr:hypothetical protein [Lachnospiraceae bacterium]
MKKKCDWIKLITLAGTGLGFAATMISNWASNKEQEAMIEEKVNEAFAKRNSEMGS